MRCSRSLALTLLMMACGLAGLACETPSAAEAKGAPRGAPSAETPVVHETALAPLSVEQGRELVVKHECNRCHEGTGLAAPPPSKHCVRCHEEIAAGRFAAPPATLAKWKPRVEPLRHAPSLSRIGALITPKWVASYLLEPHDLRPALHAQMPRLALEVREAEAIASYLGSLRASGSSGDATPEASVASVGDADRGRLIFQWSQCGTCHAFTGSGMRQPAIVARAEASKVLAPDLAFARKRLRRDRTIAWIRDPQALAPDARMPKQDVPLRDAVDLAAFIFDAPLDPPIAKAAPERLPLLDRKVGYDEVAERVLHKICWHCHAQPDFARGDGGPGHSGGFGFAARDLDLSSYEAIASGYRDAAGERTSLFATVDTPSGREPVLLAVLLARHDEARGQPGRLRGMPLGLPPIPPEDVQLVASWIAQGHPR